MSERPATVSCFSVITKRIAIYFSGSGQRRRTGISTQPAWQRWAGSARRGRAGLCCWHRTRSALPRYVVWEKTKPIYAWKYIEKKIV